MPIIKVDLQIGKDKKTLIKLRDLIMDSVIDVLQLPADDRNIRISEHEKDMFQMKSPYEVLVDVSLFAGRTKETKKKLYQEIVGRLESNGIVERQKVFIILNEIELENWGVRGGIPADEVDLGFKVKI